MHGTDQWWRPMPDSIKTCAVTAFSVYLFMSAIAIRWRRLHQRHVMGAICRFANIPMMSESTILSGTSTPNVIGAGSASRLSVADQSAIDHSKSLLMAFRSVLVDTPDLVSPETMATIDESISHLDEMFCLTVFQIRSNKVIDHI